MARSSVGVTKFINCRQLRCGQLVTEDLYVQHGHIIDPQEWFYSGRARVAEVVDCGGCIVAPGYIDVQINGGFGIDFSTVPPDNSAAAIRAGRADNALEAAVLGVCSTLGKGADNLEGRTLDPR